MVTAAGRRDRKIRVERQLLEAEAAGGERAAGWVPVETPWAMVRYGTAQERRDAAGTNASQVATFRVLSSAALRSVSAGGRIVFEGGNWNIVGAVSVGGPASEIEFTAILAKG